MFLRNVVQHSTLEVAGLSNQLARAHTQAFAEEPLQSSSSTMGVKGVPIELLLSPVTQASGFAAEHCLVRTAITRAWQIGELRALSVGAQ